MPVFSETRPWHLLLNAFPRPAPLGVPGPFTLGPRCGGWDGDDGALRVGEGMPFPAESGIRATVLVAQILESSAQENFWILVSTVINWG